MNHDFVGKRGVLAAALLIGCIILGSCTAAKAQNSPAVAEAKQQYTAIKNNLLKAAAKMPEENYSFKTVPQVRTYGEMIAHVADVQTLPFAAPPRASPSREWPPGKRRKTISSPLSKPPSIFAIPSLIR